MKIVTRSFQPSSLSRDGTASSPCWYASTAFEMSRSIASRTMRWCLVNREMTVDLPENILPRMAARTGNSGNTGAGVGGCKSKTDLLNELFRQIRNQAVLPGFFASYHGADRREHIAAT